MRRSSARRGRFDFLFVVTALYGGALAALWLVQHVVGERSWVGTLLTYAPQPIYALPLAVFTLAALLRLNWRALRLDAVLAAGFLFLFLGFNIPVPSAAPPEDSLKVMTLNIHHGSGGVGEVVRLIREREPHVVCLQEANAYAEWGDPVPLLARKLPDYRLVRTGEMATLSRLPVHSSRVVPLTDRGWRRGALEATVAWKQGRVKVLNVHLLTSANGKSLATSRGRLREYLSHTGNIRSEQIASILEWRKQQSDPVIVTGDFNTPPRGRLYSRLTREMQDTFEQCGAGFGYSYSSQIPVLRIDYVFVSDGIRPVQCETLPVRVSDHRPVLAHVVVPGEPERMASGD